MAQTPWPTQPVSYTHLDVYKRQLAFSTRLRHDLKKACRQLDEGEGQEDVTISKEVEALSLIHI